MKRYRIDVFASGTSLPATDSYCIDALDFLSAQKFAVERSHILGHDPEDLVITEEESDLDRIYF